MTAIDPQVNGQPPAPTVQQDLEVVQSTLLRSMNLIAAKAPAQTSAAETKDLAAAVKSLADAYVVLDPAVDGTGVPLEHQMQLEAMRQEGQERLEEARSRQNAPAEKKRKLSMRRRSDGGTDYEMEG